MKQDNQQKRCPNCAYLIPAEAKQCPICKLNLAQPDLETSIKSKPLSARSPNSANKKWFAITLIIITIFGTVAGTCYYASLIPTQAPALTVTPELSAPPSNSPSTSHPPSSSSPTASPTTPATPTSSPLPTPSPMPTPSPNPAHGVMTAEVRDLILNVNSSYPFRPYDTTYESIPFIRGKVLVFSIFDQMPNTEVFDVESLLPSDMIAKSPGENMTVFAVFNPRDYTSSVYVVAVYSPEKILVGPQAVFVNYTRENAINRALAEYITSLPVSNLPPTYTARNPRIVEISAAIEDNLISAHISGEGLETISVNVTSNTDYTMNITIQPGTVFQVQTAGVQNMVALYKNELSLGPRLQDSFYVSVACFNMESETPGNTDAFTISRIQPPADLGKLLGIPDFSSKSFRVQQFAIWTITENPTRYGYVGLTTGLSPFGTGPSDTELQEIQTLFTQAGIFLQNYRAFNPS